MRRLITLLTALAVALTPTVVAPTPVAAANFGSGPCNATDASQCVANNHHHLVFRSTGLTALQRQWTQTALTQDYDPDPDLLILYTDTITSSDDVRVYRTSQPGSMWVAKVLCSVNATYGTLHGLTWCKPQLVWYNDGGHPHRYDTGPEVQAIACHELGHSLGLKHIFSGHDPNYLSSCMRDVPTTPLHLIQHDKNHLASFYP